MYTTLFQPLCIGPREAHNRILFGSHTTNYARHNLLSEQHADYYGARAAGGAGVIVLEEHIVHPSDLPYAYAPLGYLPETPAAIARVVERIHTYNTLALVQLNHTGQQVSGDLTQREVWAPSAVPDVASREVPRVMELADIQAVIEGFALVARHAVQGNADGVELQVADRSLLRQFLSPLTNTRDDQYGGSPENRLRFVQETIEAVNAALGTDRVLGVRLCADELAPWAGITPEQSVEIARLLTATGRIDYLTVTMGSIFSTQMFPFHASMHVPRGYATHLASTIKAVVPIPIFAAGRIMNAAQAERLLVEGQTDGVEMIRALIADPDLPRLSQAGHAEDVRPCISCNQGCQVRTVMNVPLRCNVNPDVLANSTQALPGHLQDSGTPRPGHPQGDAPTLRTGGTVLVVVGGGPAGMEAARTAALQGRHVVLYERENTLVQYPETDQKNEKKLGRLPPLITPSGASHSSRMNPQRSSAFALGGAVTLAAKGPGRGELQLIADYLRAQLEKLGVEVHLGVEVTAEMLLAQRPEAVLIATGARTGHGLLPLAGYDLPHVTDVRRILRDERIEGQRVVVIDETASHGVLSVAELLATEGRSVEIISEDWYVGRDLVATHDIVGWMQRAMALGVVLTPHTTVHRIEPGQVIVSDRFTAGERPIAADVVVLGTYDQPSQELYYALKGRVPRLYRAGDCIAPRRIEHAISEGRQVGAM